MVTSSKPSKMMKDGFLIAWTSTKSSQLSIPVEEEYHKVNTAPLIVLMEEIHSKTSYKLKYSSNTSKVNSWRCSITTTPITTLDSQLTCLNHASTRIDLEVATRVSLIILWTKIYEAACPKSEAIRKQTSSMWTVRTWMRQRNES